VRDEHRVQVLDAAQRVAQLGLPDLDDEGRRLGLQIGSTW